MSTWPPFVGEGCVSMTLPYYILSSAQPKMSIFGQNAHPKINQGYIWGKQSHSLEPLIGAINI